MTRKDLSFLSTPSLTNGSRDCRPGRRCAETPKSRTQTKTKFTRILFLSSLSTATLFSSGATSYKSCLQLERRLFRLTALTALPLPRIGSPSVLARTDHEHRLFRVPGCAQNQPGHSHVVNKGALRTVVDRHVPVARIQNPLPRYTETKQAKNLVIRPRRSSSCVSAEGNDHLPGGEQVDLSA